MSVVTLADVEVSLGRSVTDSMEQRQVEQWIEDAETIIFARLGDLAALDQGVLAFVVREAVVGKVKRPDPAQRVEIAVDDGRISRQYDSDTGQVTILDEWWAMLVGGTETGAFSVSPYFEADYAWPYTDPFGWVSLP